MRRTVVVLAGLAMLALAAGVAQASVLSGTYSGRTSQSSDISFTVVRSKKFVSGLEIARMRLTCPGGAHVALRGESFAPIRLSPTKGTFAGTLEGETGRLHVRGRIRGAKARGSLNGTVKVNDEHRLDPNGEIRCSSGDLGWTTKQE
jgi:hypothetical protein